MFFKLPVISGTSLLSLTFLWITTCILQHVTHAVDEKKPPVMEHPENSTKYEASPPFIFDLASSPATILSPGGQFSVARSKEWPTLERHGVSASLVVGAPCSVGLPHIHATATELVYIFDVPTDGNSTVGMVVNGVLQEIAGARNGHLVVVPKGTVHYFMNQGCKAGSFIQFYNDVNLGTSVRTAPETLLLPTNILEAAFNQDREIIENMKKNVPSSFEALRQDKECLRRCGLSGGS